MKTILCILAASALSFWMGLNAAPSLTSESRGYLADCKWIREAARAGIAEFESAGNAFTETELKQSMVDRMKSALDDFELERYEGRAIFSSYKGEAVAGKPSGGK